MYPLYARVLLKKAISANIKKWQIVPYIFLIPNNSKFWIDTNLYRTMVSIINPGNSRTLVQKNLELSSARTIGIISRFAMDKNVSVYS